MVINDLSVHAWSYLTVCCCTVILDYCAVKYFSPKKSQLCLLSIRIVVRADTHYSSMSITWLFKMFLILRYVQIYFLYLELVSIIKWCAMFDLLLKNVRFHYTFKLGIQKLRWWALRPGAKIKYDQEVWVGIIVTGTFLVWGHGISES